MHCGRNPDPDKRFTLEAIVMHLYRSVVDVNCGPLKSGNGLRPAAACCPRVCIRGILAGEPQDTNKLAKCLVA